MGKSVTAICEKIIRGRIIEAQVLLDSANECLAGGDYFQAAVRLKALEDVGRFSEFELEMIDAVSGKAP